MDEVQTWWEVPAVAHFCYVFRLPFNLFFFDIDELESALLNIQDPDMSISSDQLVMRLLQGFYDPDEVSEDNWEEKLHELFNDNFEDDQNPLGESYFFQLTPRSKIETIFKLCELRLDVEGAFEDIKNIPSEDMQAKCIGKDSQNNTYWYFCNERLYKEVNFTERKVTQSAKTTSVKNNSNKINRQSTRQVKTKTNINFDKPWTVACFNTSDWEQLLKSLSKSKNTQDKELSAAMKEHLPLLQEKVAEKDRLLRKRFLELAPKRSSSRISRVQEKKRQEEIKAEEVAKKAKLDAEKERAKKEALLLKEMKESRQRRAEERCKAVEERAERAKFRELARSENSSSSEEDVDDKKCDIKMTHTKCQKKTVSKGRKSRRTVKEENEDDSENDERSSRNTQQRTSKKTQTIKNNLAAEPDTRRCIRTYSKQQSKNNDLRPNATLKNTLSKHLLNSSESKPKDASNSINGKRSPRYQRASQSVKIESNNNEFNNKNTYNSHSSNSANNGIKNYSTLKTDDSSHKQNSINLSGNYSNRSQSVATTLPQRVSVYKSSVLQNSSDVSKWKAAFDSKRQKVHILYTSSDNLASKKIKLDQVNFKAVSPNMKSSLSKENHLYKPVQTAFITYGVDF